MRVLHRPLGTAPNQRAPNELRSKPPDPAAGLHKDWQELAARFTQASHVHHETHGGQLLDEGGDDADNFGLGSTINIDVLVGDGLAAGTWKS